MKSWSTDGAFVSGVKKIGFESEIIEMIFEEVIGAGLEIPNLDPSNVISLNIDGN